VASPGAWPLITAASAKSEKIGDSQPQHDVAGCPL
jgi:hypothetical protein